MDESIYIANKKKAHQKPPLSVGRVVGEIITGEVTGSTAAAIAYLFFWVVSHVAKGESVGGGSMCDITLWDLVMMGIMLLVVPAVYGLGSAVGVYLVGSRGNQTGSFLATLGFGLIGAFVMLIMYFPVILISTYLIIGVENIVRWALLILVSFIPPIFATLGFNSTRRYEIQEKRTNIAKSVARITLIVLAACSIVPIWMYHSDVGDIGFLIPIILFVLALVLK